VSRIGNHDPKALEDLYDYLNRVVRPQIRFKLPEQEPDDILHETLTVVVEAIQAGVLRNPDYLRGYVQSVARRLVARRIVRAIWKRRRTVSPESVLTNAPSADNPESQALHRERGELIVRGLRRMRSRDSELLTRFYLLEEPFQEICRDMQLTETQFRLYKSRAKAKLTAWIAQRESAPAA
jgi:RNA polymerase sigma factor (sigma-70 family)